MMKFSTLLVCWCALTALAYGQGDVRTRGSGSGQPAPAQSTRKITGRILDAAGQPLQGASVSIVDPANGAVLGGGYTDANGAYSLDAPDGRALRLRVTYVGFGDYTAPIGASGAQTLNATLQETETTISEQVITGYGTQYKREITGSQGSVSGEQIQSLPVTSFDQAIQGRLSGVQITASSGKLGQQVIMRVRGPKSITASNQPLIVVDNVIINQDNLNLTTVNNEPLNPLNDINPNDIEDVQLLKDAQATAIYGSRGANGVLLITTKRGKAGKATTTIDYQYGLSSPTRLRDFMDTSQYRVGINVARSNAGFGLILPQPPTTPANNRYIPGTNTDWQRFALLFDRPHQQLTVSTSGGSSTTRYFLSFGLLDQFGILVGNRLNRVNGRVSVDHDISPKVTVGGKFSLSRVLTERQADDNAFSNPLQIVAFSPLSETNNPDGTIRSADRITGYPNPLLALENSFAVNTTIRSINNVYVRTKFIENFTWYADLGVDLLDLRNDAWRGYRMSAFTGITDGSAIAGNDRILNYQTSTYVNWLKTLGEDHNFDITAGFQYQFTERQFGFVTGEGLPRGDKFRFVNSASRFTGASSGITGYRFDSYFARLNYKWRERLLVGASIRTDGSSRFGKNNRYGTFYGVSAGYILSEEEFIKNIEFISLIKPRISYGTAGNAEIGNFASLNLSSPTAYKVESGVVFNGLGDPNLKWEQTATLNLGLDFGFFNDRLTGTFDYFRSKTTDLLLNRLLPAQSGFLTVLQNLGTMENNGWEFSITGKVLTGEVKWDASFNITEVANTVTDAGLNSDGTPAVVFAGTDLQSVAQRGDAIGSFLGARYYGVDPANGDALYYLNERGDLTNDWSSAQRQIIGNPNPRFFGGVTNTVTWKSFDFTMFWQFAMGHSVFDNAGQFMTAGFGGGRDNQVAGESAFWQRPGDATAVPKPYFFGIGSPNGENGSLPSSRHVQNASFWRLKTLTIGYSLPTEWVNKLYMQKVRVYVTAQNLLTVTQFTGWDPEVNTAYNATSNQAINLIQGWDFYTVPQPRTFVFGLTVTF